MRHPYDTSPFSNVIPFQAPTRGQMISTPEHGTYFMGDYIGSGAYGDVYECTDEWANPLVAKVLRPAMPFAQVRLQWETEVANLNRMRHPNITYIHDAFVYDNAFYIIVEKCLYGLDRVITRVDQSWVPHIARDVLQALSFIHRLGYVHKDVHAGNVFVTHTSQVINGVPEPRFLFKLGDLGVTRMEEEIRMAGTALAPWMRPPEGIDPVRYGVIGQATDVYHTALLLLSVLRREVHQFGETEILAGAPYALARSTSSVFAPALCNALIATVSQRTQTALEFWRQLQGALAT